jgi:AcrR family transcriptional regulator
MRKEIKKEQKPDRGRGSGSGRVAQRNRTRKAIVDAAMRLMATGRTPSIADVVQEAQVSRRTIYMYFPTVEQLLLDATLGALSTETIDPVIGASGSVDAVTRVEELVRAVNRLSAGTMHLGRALIRLTVENDKPHNGAPRRGYRRIEWIERALEPVRSKLTRKQFDRLVSALSLVIGWEALIVLKDVRGLEQKEAEDVLVFAARAIVDAALHAPPRAKR